MKLLLILILKLNKKYKFNKYFIDCILITIAHRIKTIINYHKILVLDNGQIKEFDKPNILLQNKQSLFYQLYNKSSI